MNRSNGTSPVLLVSTPIEDALAKLEAKADDREQWDGENTPVANAIRLCVGRVREAMREATELWRTTSETARVTGWSDETLTRHARLMEVGTPEVQWRAMEVRRGPTGYLFRVSTVPARRRKS